MRRAAAVRVIGPMRWIVYPSLMAMAGTILLATPIEFFGLKLPELVLPMVLAFAWPLIRPSMLAPVALLVLGLFLEILWGAQLGLWSVALLGVYGLVLASRNFLIGQDTPVLFFWYALATFAAFVSTYVIQTVIAGNAPSLLAWLGQLVPTLLLFPLSNALIERFDDGDVRMR